MTAPAAPIAVVTGGAGFIGSHMVDLLRDRGIAVRVLDNLVGGRADNLAHHQNDAQVTLDTRDMVTVAGDDALYADADYVFHFAGIGDIVPSIDQPVDYMRANVMGTVAALEGARAAHGGRGARKFVYAASSTCYGLAATPTREDHPIDPKYPYALSKNMGEQAAFHWHQLYGLPVNSIRIFNAYGTRSRTTGAYGAVFGVFLKQKLVGQPYTVVGDGDPQSVNRLVALLGGEKTHIPKRPGEPDCTWADIAKITDQLGWRPEISFADGVARIVQNIDYWAEAPLWTPENIERQTATWFRYLSGPRQD